ncbi:glycosyltransferase family 4 protein [Bizionia argentinensis JUB59]|uniref:Glycosyltransferase family 4 protein n=1 Tax=Bizionia argentinensis JUB59 TaxID=1046627 RepID=G2E9B8_9FLAO|nr:glycosyltransferase family 4 protein [Bizionia argentinensis]EGV44811.1 glycosyltransferase family 4 protein [Bizionia argentinensis JUB59]
MPIKKSKKIAPFLAKPKIAFIISSLTPGGAERVVSTLANAFVEDYHVLIITLYNNKPFYSLDERVQLVSCKLTYSNKKHILHSLAINYKLIRRIYIILKKEKADLAIGFMTTTNIYTIIASQLLNIPNIISERTHPEYSSLTNLWSKIRRQVYPYCGKLIVQTRVIKTYFEEFLGPSKINIIRNPLSESMLNFQDSNIKGEHIVLSVGRLTAVKNHKMLIEAFCELDIDHWKLIIIGEGRLRNELELLIKKYQAEDRIDLIGTVNNVQDFYNRAGIFAFTSNYEGFPNTLTEAMAFGLPCVSTNCPSGPSEIIDSGKNGLLIPVGDKNALKVELKRLIENPNLRKNLGIDAKESTRNYEIAIIKSQWKLIIDTALKI